MKSIFRKILTACLLVGVMLTACACGGNNNNGGNNGGGSQNADAYNVTVTVIDQDTRALEGATVKFFLGKSCKATVTTDKNGVATFKGELDKKALYSVKVTLDGYTAEENEYLLDSATELTAKLTKDPEKITYKVTVVDENGAKVAGAWVQVCKDQNCLQPVQTDANGVAVFKLDPDSYKATISYVEGYSYSKDYTYFPTGETEITIVVTTNS